MKKRRKYYTFNNRDVLSKVGKKYGVSSFLSTVVSKIPWKKPLFVSSKNKFHEWNTKRVAKTSLGKGVCRAGVLLDHKTRTDLPLSPGSDDFLRGRGRVDLGRGMGGIESLIHTHGTRQCPLQKKSPEMTFYPCDTWFHVLDS